ncbi:MAG: hypothetical protein ABI591_29645 [Kofleriaceae bacterium]
MTSANPRAGWLATSDDGRWVAWSERTRLVLVDATTWTLAGELRLDLEPPVTLAMCSGPDRLLVVQTRNSTTRVRVLSVPELQPLAEGSLETAARLAAVVGATAVLVAGPDTMTALDLAELQTTKLTVRGPIEIVAPFSNDQVLVAARGKLEAWSLEERRPTHRLGLTLPKNPRFAGLAASGTLLWAVSANAPGTVTAFRLSDGTQLGESTLGGAPVVVLGVAASPTLIALVQPDSGAELVAIDLLTHHRRVLPFDAPIVAVGVAGDTVVVLPETGIPMLIPLTGGAARPILAVSAATTVPARVELPAEAPAVAASSVVVSRLDEWRAQVQTAITVTTAMPPSKEPAIRVLGEEPRSRSRAELFAWGETVRARHSTAPPPPPHVWNLTELAHRFGIDLRSRSVIALLYAAWLDGDGRKGVPVGHIARALGNDELAWIEALAQGRLGRLGWIRSKLGRTRLHPQLGRFLDEARPRVKLVAPALDTVKTLEPPTSPSLWRAREDEGADKVVALASACGIAIAVIDLDALPPHRFERVLGDRLLEARLHGALPVLVGEGFAMLDVARLDGGVLLAPRGTRPAALAALPLWPPETSS